MADVVLNGVSKKFGATSAVENMNMQVFDGEFVVLLGPTGAGKTTTLRLVAGLEKPDSGSIVIDGQDMTASAPAARDVTFVFQQYSLYPHLSVFDNLAFPLRSPARRLAEDEIRRRIEDVARLLRISDKLENRATQLSGGEMQRVAIGRALVRQPTIYLMDEPLSSLDAKLRAELRLELKRIQEDLGATILYVTHDQIEAMAMADKIALMSLGELLQYGAPMELYRNPNCAEVAEFFGSVNWLPGQLVEPNLVETQIGRFEITGNSELDRDVLVGFRPECMAFARDNGHNHFRATLQSNVFLGDQFVYDAAVGDTKLVGKSRAVPKLEAGRLHVYVNPADVMVFAANEKNTAFVDSVGAQV